MRGAGNLQDVMEVSALPDSVLAGYDAIMPNPMLFLVLNPSISQLIAKDPGRKMAIESDSMNFVHADAAPALLLDEIVWKTVKGARSSMPIMHETLPMGVHAPADTDDDGD
jgi:hypothetical protein